MIRVFNCGHDSHHKKACDIFHPAGLNNYLFLLFKQHAWFMAEGKKYTVTPNSVILFPPHVPVHYGCDTADYNDDWIHFDLPWADAGFFHAFGFPYSTVMLPRDFLRLSGYAKIISDEFHSDGIYREEIVDKLMHSFLCVLDEEIKKTAKLSASSPVSQKYYRKFAEIRTQIYNSPSTDWSASQLADTLCVSCSHFQHLYKHFFGCSCQHDIILAKVSLAKFYLSTTDMGIRQLSAFCGYETDLHFMRQFKKYTGVTPSEYRAQACASGSSAAKKQ